MADKQQRRFSWSALAGDGLLLLCALTGLTGSFLSLYGDAGAPLYEAAALDRAAADAGLFLACAALFALLSLAAFSLPRLWGAAAGGLAALLALLVWWSWDGAVQGAGLTVHTITLLFSQRVDWGRVFQYDPGLSFLEECAAVRTFLILALALIALLLGWAVVRTRCWWLALEFTLPPLLPGLLADLYPDWLWFMALAACWCVMILTYLCRWAAPDRRGRLTLAAFPAVAAALLLITALFPREGYTRPAWARKAEEGLMNLTSRAADRFSQWDGPFRAPVTYVGAAEEADLTRAGPLSYTGRTVLRMTSDYNGWMYLRGSSLAVYEGGVWRALPEGAWQEYLDYLGTLGGLAPQPDTPLLFPALQMGHDGEYTVTIDNVGAVGACVYTPYYLTEQDWAGAGMLPVEDSYLARKQGQWTHTASFAALAFQEPDARRDDVYADFVYEHYLDVPDELRDVLDQHCGMIDPADFYGVDSLAETVAEYLDTLCEYDPAAPAAPDGTDPVLYFLTDSRRGYCMHYASAAVLLLREMGIPARYVSGFAAQSVPDRYVDVPDRAAHAWVEVWVDGFGWYPVEATPAAAFDWAGQGGPDDPSAAVSDPASEPTLEPTPTPAPTEGPEPSAAPPGSGDSPSGPGRPGPAPALLGALKALGAAAGGALLLWLIQFLLKGLRAARMAGADPNRAALYAYACLERMERWGGETDGRAVELAQKARFSQHTLTRQELDLLRGLVDRERERLCAAPGLPRRLAFRYLWGRPRPPAGGNEQTQTKE